MSRDASIRAARFKGFRAGLGVSPRRRPRTVSPRSRFKVESNLRAGVAKIDITPPPDAKVVGHVRPTHGARDPIRAAILLLYDGQTRAAIVTFDLLCSVG